MLPAIIRLLQNNARLSSLAYARLGPEDKLAVHVAAALREWSLTGRLEGVWTHPPQEVAGGSKLARVRYAIACAMGAITGVPDYLFIASNGGALVELKSKRGKLTASQEDYRAWAVSQGVPHRVCRTLEEVEAFLIETGLLAPVAGYAPEAA